MRIESIRIENFRGARSCNMDLSKTDSLCVFAGANGSGKTSLIEACRVCLGQVYGVRSLPKMPFVIEVGIFANDGFRYNIHRDYTSHIIVGPNGTRSPFTAEEFQRLGLSSSWYFTSWRDPRLTDGVDIQTLDTPPAFVPGATREETLIIVKNTLVRWDVTAQFNRNPQQMEAVRSLFNRLSNARNMFFPNSPGQFVSQSVGETMTPGSFVTEATSSHFKFDLFFRRDQDGVMIPVNDLSSGELEVLCFLGIMLLNEGLSTVYIDEPELHLNLQWHQTLLRALRLIAPRVQFLVATHSSEIWSSAFPQQRFYMNEGMVANA